MKGMKRAIAVIVAILLIAATVPAARVQAATSAKLNVSARTIFVGGSTVVPGTYKNGYYTLKLKNKAAKYSCEWKTDKPDIIKIEKVKKSKVKVTALKPGKAVVTAVYTDKKTNTRRDLECVITVKRNCSAMDIKGYSSTPMEIGASMQLEAELYDKAGKILKAGEDVTDIIKWVSSDTKVATVSANGKVTAIGGGKADITCYTISADNKKYSPISKATAKKTVPVEVEDPDIIGITGLKVKSLDTIEVEFGADFGSTFTKDNLSITRANSVNVGIKEMTLSNDRMKAVIKLGSEMTDLADYTVVLKNTTATVDLMRSFTFKKGIPTSLDIVTDIPGNKVVAQSKAQLKFRIYNAEGVDITPLSETSTEYQNYKNYIKFEELERGNWFVDSSDGTIYVYDVNKTVGVKAVYYGLAKVNGVLTTLSFEKAGYVQSVSEASTLVFNAATDIAVSNGRTPGSKLKFDTGAIVIPIGDTEATTLVARLKDHNGNYIYSDESDSITFDTSTDINSCYVTAHGSVMAFAKGTVQVNIKYKGTFVGAAVLQIVDGRKAAAVVFEVNGKAAESVIVSDRYEVGTCKVDFKVIDQYGKLIPIRNSETLRIAENVTVSRATESQLSPNGIAYGNADGTGYIKYEVFGYGTSGGSVYKYKITYSDSTYGSAVGYFSLIVKTPSAQAASTYSAEVEGNTDITLASEMSELPYLSIKAYEMKEGLKYDVISPIYTPDTVTYEGSCFYRLYDSKGSEIRTSGIVANDKIYPVYINSSGNIAKLSTGKYKINIYRKDSSGTRMIATAEFTLTETSSKLTIEKKASVSNERITAATASDTEQLRRIFDECFILKKGDNQISSSNVYFTGNQVISDTGAVFFVKATVRESVTIGGRTYPVENTVDIGQLIQSR